jgi:hypothetical protein
VHGCFGPRRSPRLHETLATGKPEILALRYDWRNNSVLFVHNLSAIPTEVKFDSRAKVDGHLVNLLSNDHSTPDSSGGHYMLLNLMATGGSASGPRLPVKANRNLGISTLARKSESGDSGQQSRNL